MIIQQINPLHAIVRFTLNSSTRIIEFRGFLSHLSTKFHEILHTLFSIHIVTTLKISRSFVKYVRPFDMLDHLTYKKILSRS